MKTITRDIYISILINSQYVCPLHLHPGVTLDWICNPYAYPINWVTQLVWILLSVCMTHVFYLWVTNVLFLGISWFQTVPCNERRPKMFLPFSHLINEKVASFLAFSKSWWNVVLLFGKEHANWSNIGWVMIGRNWCNQKIIDF